MNRKYFGDKQNISSLVKNKQTGKEFVISTATQPGVPVWQLGVIDFENGNPDPFKPLFFDRTYSFEDAEKLHIATEKLVSDRPESEWVQTKISD